MYTRQSPQESSELRIPENYRGNAFHGDALTPSPPIEIPQEPKFKEEITEVTADTLPAILPISEEKTAAPAFKKAAPFSSLLPPRLAGTRGGLLGDIGIEELLIIGILILLSQSETDDDILLLLVLLLFYK